MMVTYQMFTQTAVSTVLTLLNSSWPSLGQWFLLRTDMIIFIYAFAWVFLLSSVIPSLLLGKERSVLLQFSVCLALTFLAFTIQGVVDAYWSNQFQTLQTFSALLDIPLFATVYLSMPYVIMLAIDIRAWRKRRISKQLHKVIIMYAQRPEEPNEKTRPQVRS
jgi:hypothetical protein